MFLNTTKSPKSATLTPPARGVVSALKAINHAAQPKGGTSPQNLLEELIKAGAGKEADIAVEQLLNATTAAESYLRRLREGLEERRAKDAVERQLQQGQTEFEVMIEKKVLLDPAEFIRAMNWTKQALSKALGANRVFYLEHMGRRYYPKFFSDTQYERRQLAGVSQALGELPGASKWQFMSTPKGSLDEQTPLAALKSGKYSRVKVAAAGFVER